MTEATEARPTIATPDPFLYRPVPIYPADWEAARAKVRSRST